MDNACSKSKNYIKSIDPNEWTRFARLVFKEVDFVHHPIDAVFVHAWGDLRYQLIQHVAKVFRLAHGARCIVLNGLPEYETGLAGYQFWKRAFMTQYLIPETHIRATRFARHTHEEALEFIDIARKEGFRSVAIVTLPFHLPRAFLTSLAVCAQYNYPLQLLPSTFWGINWHEEVIHRSIAGEMGPTSRLGRFASECARIIEYRRRMEAGDSAYAIATVAEGIKYLEGGGLK
ncbi:MAG: ElyC/SanA/YdcF family protein [Patescibacteria group bacterium]